MTPALPPVATPTRFPVLDGLRGLAILLVLWHQQNLLPAPFDVEGTERMGASVDLVFSHLADAAWIGVDVFFVLSGFLITRVLLQTKRRKRYFSRFFTRRALRVLPLYYAVLVLTFFVLPHVADPNAEALTRIAGTPAMYWAHLQNLPIARAGDFQGGLLDVSWTLAIIVQFYVLWPLYVYLLNRWYLRWLCVAAIFAAVGFRVLSGMDELALFTLGPARMDALAAGALAASFESDEEELEGLGGIESIARTVSYGGLGVLLVCGILLGGLAWSDPMMQGVGYTILALALAATIVLCLQASDRALWKRALSSAPLRFLGRHSFALFLFHLPVVVLVRDLLYGPQDFFTWRGSRLPGQLLFHLLCTSLALLAAFASWHGLEKHFLGHQRRSRPRGRRSVEVELDFEQEADVFELDDYEERLAG